MTTPMRLASVNGMTVPHSIAPVWRRVLSATTELIVMTSSDVPIGLGHREAEREHQCGHDDEAATDTEEPGEEPDDGARRSHPEQRGEVERVERARPGRGRPPRSASVRALAMLVGGFGATSPSRRRT